MTRNESNERASHSARHVVIVGGGLAGLSAAETLASHFGDRLRITLLESKRTTGGRAGSFTDNLTGERVDYCQHVAMGCCTNFLALMQRSGLEDQFHRYAQLQFLHPDFPASDFAPSAWLPPPLHMAPTLSALKYLTSGQRREIRRGLSKLFRTSSQKLIDCVAEDWLLRHGQSSETIRDYWSVIVVSALGENIDAVSMHSVRKVFVDGFAAARGASDVLVPKLPLAELVGERLHHHIRGLGVKMQVGLASRSIQPDDSGATIVTADGDRIQADHVIAAVPWYAIAALLPDTAVPGLTAFRDIPPSPITGLHLWFSEQITDRPHAVLVGTAAQWLFRQPWEDRSTQEVGTQSPERSESKSGYYYQVVISASRSYRSMSKDELVSQVVDELRHAFPLCRGAKLLRSRVVTDPKSVFSIRPEFEAIRPPAETSCPSLHLAGDWIATGWPATMEGAVISGRMAAASLANQETWDPPSIDRGLRRGWLARLLIRD